MENISTLKGVIYSKETKKWPNKKHGEPDYEFYYFQLEFKVQDRGREVTSIATFMLGRGIGFDEFDAGDKVVVMYYPLGKKIKKKDGSGHWWKDENIVISLSFDHMDNGETRKGAESFPSIPQSGDVPDDDDLPF